MSRIGVEVVVRPMTRGDVARVASIEAETFSTPWQEETFLNLFDREGVELLVMEDAVDGVIGYAVLWCVLDQGELANVAIASQWRGRGLGRQLISRVIEAAKRRGIRKVFLEVRASNHRAAQIYRSFGFEEVGVRRGYYNDPKEDARIMMASLR